MDGTRFERGVHVEGAEKYQTRGGKVRGKDRSSGKAQRSLSWGIEPGRLPGQTHTVCNPPILSSTQ